LRGNLPCLVLIIAGKTREVRALDQLPRKPGAFSMRADQGFFRPARKRGQNAPILQAKNAIAEKAEDRSSCNHWELFKS